MTTPMPTAKLGDARIASLILGQSPPSSSYNVQHRGLPFFQGKADFGMVHPVPRVWCDAGQQFARKNDVLISVRAPVGDVNLADGDCAIGRGVTAVRAGPEADPWFLFFALQFVKPALEAQATGSTFASVNKATLLDLAIPAPTISSQRAIASALRRLMLAVEFEVDGLANTQALKRAAMRELFTRGLRGEAQKETEIGPIPEGWEAIPLERLGRIGNGSTPKRTVPEYWNNAHYPWLTSAKVYDREITRADQFVSDVALAECHLPRVKPGAVLIAITGQGKTLGHCAVLSIEASVSQHVAYIQVDPAVADSGFVRGFLETQYEYLRQIASGGGSTKGALTCAFLRSFQMPLPPVLEQREIVAILDAIDRKIALHKEKRAVLEALFKSLLHKLMTGEVRVADLNLGALGRAAEAA